MREGAVLDCECDAMFTERFEVTNGLSKSVLDSSSAFKSAMIVIQWQRHLTAN